MNFVKYFTSVREKREKEKHNKKAKRQSFSHRLTSISMCNQWQRQTAERERQLSSVSRTAAACACTYWNYAKKWSNVFVTCLFSVSLVYFSVVFGSLFSLLSLTLSLSLSLACCFTQIVLYGLNTPVAYAMITENEAATNGRYDGWSACCR